MTARSTLVGVSAAQLATGLAGLAVALRRRRNFDVGFLRGSPDHVGRDALWGGTAYSALSAVPPGPGRVGSVSAPRGTRACRGWRAPSARCLMTSSPHTPPDRSGGTD